MIVAEKDGHSSIGDKLNQNYLPEQSRKVRVFIPIAARSNQQQTPNKQKVPAEMLSAHPNQRCVQEVMPRPNLPLIEICIQNMQHSNCTSVLCQKVPTVVTLHEGTMSVHYLSRVIDFSLYHQLITRLQTFILEPRLFPPVYPIPETGSSY